jgi:hypothetical protein
VVEDRVPDADLARAREEVLASVARLAGNGGLSLRPATLAAEQPLRRPPAELAGKLDARSDAGLDTDDGYPRRVAAMRAAVPAATVAGLGVLVLAGVAVTVALTSAHLAILAVVALVVLVAGGAAVGSLALYASRDRLRLGQDDRRALQEARTWQSRQSWIGPAAESRERRLVFVAVDIVAGIVGSEAWASRYLDEHRIRLDLASELDEIDEQAHRLARVRAESPGAEAVSQGWDAVVDRVAALSLYAERLRDLTSELERRAVEERAALADEQAATLVAGSVRDELAADHVRALTEDLRDLGPTDPR